MQRSSLLNKRFLPEAVAPYCGSSSSSNCVKEKMKTVSFTFQKNYQVVNKNMLLIAKVKQRE
jgi:hypothetical protein